MNFQKLLEVGSEVECELLDAACIRFSSSDSRDPAFNEINQILTQFLDRPDNMRFCTPILQGQFHSYTKFLCCQILKKNIIQSWISYPDDERDNMRKFVLGCIVDMVNEGQKNYTISMANQALIEILKYDWPANWPTFINELISTCQSIGIHFIKNALEIIKMLADEISPISLYSYGSSSVSIQKGRQKAMQDAFIEALPTIYTLLAQAFSINDDSAQFNIDDVKEINNKVLDSLSSIVFVVDTERLLNTPLVSGIRSLLMNNDFTFRVFLLFGKFCENISKTVVEENIEAIFENSLLEILRNSIQKIVSMIGENVNFNCVDSNDMILLVSALNSYFKLFLPFLTQEKYGREVTIATGWVIQITNTEILDITEERLFSELIQFWHLYGQLFYKTLTNQNSQFQDLYSNAISAVIPVLVRNIVSPYTFFEVVDDISNKIKKTLNTDSYESTLFDSMKELLVLIYHTKKEELINAITSQIGLVQSNQFTLQTLNSISWTIGAISRALSDEENSSLATSAISIYVRLIHEPNEAHDQLVEDIRETASKDLLFLCSQESKYFKRNPDFLDSLAQLIIRFITSDDLELNIIAIHTFTLLSKKCKEAFLMPISGGAPIVNSLLEVFPRIIGQIKVDYRNMFVSSLAEIIYFYETTNPSAPGSLVNPFLDVIFGMFMSSISQIEAQLNQFSNIVNAASRTFENIAGYQENLVLNGIFFQQLVLIDPNILGDIINTLLIISILPKSLKSLFDQFFFNIHSNILKLYELALNNASLLMCPTIESIDFQVDQRLFNLGKSSIQLYNDITYLIPKISENLFTVIRPNSPVFMPILIGSTLLGYNFHSIPAPAMPSALLTMFAALFRYNYSFEPLDEQLKAIFVHIIFQVFNFIYMPVMNLIKDEYDLFPELRLALIAMIQGFVRGFPQFIFMLTDEQISMLVNLIMWFTKHPYENISSSAIELCVHLIKTLNTANIPPERLEFFWNNYFSVFVSQMLTLLSDSVYKFGFDGQTLVLCTLLQMPIADSLRTTVISSFQDIFNYVDSEVIVNQLYEKRNSLLDFRFLLKDFLIQLKNYSPKDPELNAVELFKKKRDETLRDKNIPGLDKSAEIQPEDLESEMSILKSLFESF